MGFATAFLMSAADYQSRTADIRRTAPTRLPFNLQKTIPRKPERLHSYTVTANHPQRL